MVAAAIVNARRACGESPAWSIRNAAPIRSPTGSTGGSGADPRSCSGVRWRAASRMANGFPAVSCTRRWTVAGVVLCCLSSSADWSALSPDSLRWLTPDNSAVVGVSRRAISITTASCPTRRAANSRTVNDSGSIHCRSSIRTRTGRCCAAAESRARVAALTRKRSCGAPSADQPRALSSASRCGGGMSASQGRRGATMSASAACPMANSPGTPVARRHLNPVAAVSAASSREVFPMPGGPVKHTPDPRPARASLRAEAMTDSSVSRPTSTGVNSTVRLPEVVRLRKARAVGGRREYQYRPPPFVTIALVRVRFTHAARRHKIGQASVLFVMEENDPNVTTTRRG